MATVEMDEGGGGGATQKVAPIPETPTQAVVRKANVEQSITLPDGRVVNYRPLRTLERMDLNSLAGPQNAVNIAWMADASIAYSVTSIDGEKLPKPTSMMQLRAQIQRIGDDGMDALSEKVIVEVTAEQNSGELEKRAGNLHGTLKSVSA